MTSRKVTTVMTKDHDINNTDNTKIPIKVVDRPTFILKTREGESRAVSPNQRNGTKYVVLLNIHYIIHLINNYDDKKIVQAFLFFARLFLFNRKESEGQAATSSKLIECKYHHFTNEAG